MTCKTIEFKKFQRRIRRTLYYANCGNKRQAVTQMVRKVSDCFTDGYHSGEFDEIVDKLIGEGYVSPCNILTGKCFSFTILKIINFFSFGLHYTPKKDE